MTGYGSPPRAHARGGEDLTRNELALLETLASEEFAGLRTLGQGAGTSLSTTRRLLHGLVDKGLATYAPPGKADGTAGSADVTPEGRDALVEHGRGVERPVDQGRERARRRRIQRLVRELDEGLAELRSLLGEAW